MNKVMLVGRMVADVELAGNEVAVARFRVAVQRNYKNSNGEYESDFVSCVAFRKTAEFVSKYFGKGKWISVTGEIRTGSYEKDGVKHYTTDIVASEVGFVGDRGSDASKVNKEVTDAELFELTEEFNTPW